MVSLTNTQITEKTVETFINAVTSSGPNLIYAVIVLGIGLYVCKLVKRYSRNFILKYPVDRGVANFISYALYVLSITGILMTCLEIIGFPIKNFITVIISLMGVVGLAVGLAFKDILANLGSGMIILFFKPFKTGDYIAGSGVEGTVSDIQIFSTVLKTPDNKAIVIPNIKLTGDNIINYTNQENRRIDFSFDVAYDSDIKLVKRVIENVFKQDGRILKDPKPIIGLNMLGDNAMQIVARPWVKTHEYWDVYFDIMEKVKVKFDENNIEIPFPSRIVYYRNAPEITDKEEK
ncbi:MAG: mechanosensitive ion channel family protein [Paraclostridium sp.]